MATNITGHQDSVIRAEICTASLVCLQVESSLRRPWQLWRGHAVVCQMWSHLETLFAGRKKKTQLQVRKHKQERLSHDVNKCGNYTYNNTILASKIHNIFREASGLWSNVAPIKFRRRIQKEADIVISFYNGGEFWRDWWVTWRFTESNAFLYFVDHNDSSLFDGKGGILAHAFLSGHGIGGDVHFDAGEDWSFNSTGNF